MKDISNALQDFFFNKNYERELDIARIWSHWESIVGSEFARIAKPLGRRGETLILGVENSLIMQEMRFHSITILERINQFLHWNPFDKVKFELLDNKSCLDQVQIEAPIKIKNYNFPISSSDVGHLRFSKEAIPSFLSCYKKYVEMVKRIEQNQDFRTNSTK